MENKNFKIKEIFDKNPTLGQCFYHWSVSYDKKADMFVFGGDFTADSYYVLLSDEDGVMVRVDKNYKILGFAIENASNFIKKYPATSTALSLYISQENSFLTFSKQLTFLK